MDNVEYDSIGERYYGTDGDGRSVTYTPDSSGDIHRATNSEGEDILEDSNGETVAYVHTYD